MKKNFFLNGVLFIIMVFGLVLFSCDTGGGGGGGDGDFSTVTTYKGTAYGKPYVLEIDEYNGETTFTFYSGSEESYGTAVKNGNNWTLTPTLTSASYPTFYVSVSSSGITGLNGIVTFYPGFTSESGPIVITPTGVTVEKVPVVQGGLVQNDSSLIGKWEVESILDADNSVHNLPYNEIESFGFTFTSDSLMIYQNGYLIDNHHCGTQGGHILGMGSDLAYSINGNELTLNGNFIYPGWTARKVATYSWE